MLTMKDLRKLVDERIFIAYVDANGIYICPEENREVLQIVKVSDSHIKVLVSL